MTASTETTERPALTRSRRPASGSRYSGSSLGPSASSRSITGTAIRNTEPHQKNSSSTPPSRGPSAAPTEKLVAHTPIANVRCLESRNMLRIRESVEGASVAAARPSSARVTISISTLVEKAASTERDAEGSGPDEEQPAAADTVAERAHRDQEAGQHEAVDVGDPEKLGARGLEIRGQRGHRQVEDGQVHRVQEAGQGDHSEPDPLPPPGARHVDHRHLRSLRPIRRYVRNVVWPFQPAAVVRRSPSC